MPRIGLSIRSAPEPLLKFIANKPRSSTREASAVDDPPLSTDEESDADGDSSTHGSSMKIASREHKEVRKSLKVPPDPDCGSSGDERMKAASVKPTRFNSSSHPNNVLGAKHGIIHTTKGDSPARTRAKRRKLPAEELSEDELASSQPTPQAPRSKPKNAFEEPPRNHGNHFKDKLGFVSTRQAKATYGKRSESDQNSQKTSSMVTLRVPASFDSPERKKPKLRIPAEIPLSSPEVASSGQTKYQASLDKKSTKTARKRDETTPVQKTKKPRLKAAPSPFKEASPPPAVFKMPSSYSQIMRDHVSGNKKIDWSDLSSDEGDAKDQTSHASVVERTESKTVCPWCGEVVDKDMWEAFTKGRRRLNVQSQTKFCKKHKKEEALATWKTLGYPEIRWDTIEDRFAKHKDTMSSIISGTPSHFRSLHAANVESGNARVLKQEDNLTPGYYGSRGFNLMSDYLVKEFGKDLKRYATSDRIIAGRGSAAFIQSVLVAELGLRLIMEDMKVDEEEGRRIMEDSKAHGDIVHED